LLRSEEKGVVRCASCGLTGELPIKPAHKEIDVYSRFTDMYYSRAKAPEAFSSAASTTATDAPQTEPKPSN
jgi:transcription elongation factor Elf1